MITSVLAVTQKFTFRYNTWVDLLVDGLDGQNKQRHRVTTLVMDHPRSQYH